MAASIAPSSASAAGERAGIDAPMVVVTAELLFALLGSGGVELTAAVFVLVAPDGALGETLKVNWNAALAPGANEAFMQVIVPGPPTAGVVQVNGGPFCCDAETKVMFAGTVSVSVTFAAAEGPAFATVTM